MRSYATISILTLFILTASLGYPQSADEIPINLQKLSEKVIVLGIGENYVTNVTAIATSKGLVVIDTNYIPSLATKLRGLFEKEFGRNDFAYVINTHWHWDHTNGNHAFRDAVIIGHERCVPALKRFEAELPGFVERRREWLARLEELLPNLKPDSYEARTIPEIIANSKIFFQEIEAGYEIIPPNLTFNDSLTIDMGDMTLKLYFFGVAHSDTDILIYAPEEKMLWVGDLFAKDWLPYINDESDVPRWLEVLGDILNEQKELECVVTGHHELMTSSDIRADYDYIRDLWEGVEESLNEGLSLEETKERLSFENRFKHLEGMIHVWEGEDYHLTNIDNVYAWLRK